MPDLMAWGADLALRVASEAYGSSDLPAPWQLDLAAGLHHVLRPLVQRACLYWVSTVLHCVVEHPGVQDSSGG